MIAQLVVVLSALLWAVPPSATTQASFKTYAVLETNFGVMVAELYPDQAPITVANFARLATEGFYIGLASHRMVPGFMLQLGKHTRPEMAEAVKPIKGEFSDTLKHYEGVLSMARANDPNSATSQFFICFSHRRTPSLVDLDGKYAIFGRLIEGYDVLRMIEMVRVLPNPQMRGEVSRPAEDIILQNVGIIRGQPPRLTAPQKVDELLDIGRTIVQAVRDRDTELQLVDDLPGYLLSAKDMIGLLHFKEGLEYHQEYLSSIPSPSVLISAWTANMTASGEVLVKPVGDEEGRLPPTPGERLFIARAGDIPLPIYRLILPSEGMYQQLSFVWVGGKWRWLGPLEEWLPAGPEELERYERQQEPVEIPAVAAEQEPLQPVPPEQRLALAVFDFKIGERISAEVARELAELCRQAVMQTQQFRLIDREQMLSVLGEQDFEAATQCPDAPCRVQYAKSLQAESIVYGRVSEVGVSYVLNLVMMDVGTSRLVAKATIKAPHKAENLIDLVAPKTQEMIRSAVTQGQ